MNNPFVHTKSGQASTEKYRNLETITPPPPTRTKNLRLEGGIDVGLSWLDAHYFSWGNQQKTECSSIINLATEDKYKMINIHPFHEFQHILTSFPVCLLIKPLQRMKNLPFFNEKSEQVTTGFFPSPRNLAQI